MPLPSPTDRTINQYWPLINILSVSLTDHRVIACLHIFVTRLFLCFRICYLKPYPLLCPCRVTSHTSHHPAAEVSDVRQHQDSVTPGSGRVIPSPDVRITDSSRSEKEQYMLASSETQEARAFPSIHWERSRLRQNHSTHTLETCRRSHVGWVNHNM